MVEKPYPAAGGEETAGAHMRYDVLFHLFTKPQDPPPPLTLEEAYRRRCEAIGRAMTTAERRAFNAGWRRGGSLTLSRWIGELVAYLSAEDVEQLNDELAALYTRYKALLK